MAVDDFLEHQYNTSFSVANEEVVLADWISRSTATRASLEFKADISYGPHIREVFDFYPAALARGTMIFIHGGYWRGLSKIETSWIADSLVGQGISVALINYPLCPEVGIKDIATAVNRAIAYLYLHVLSELERRNILISGHSAGGYLAAQVLTVDWPKLGLPLNPFSGVIGISGIYDVAPLIGTSMNADLRLDAAAAATLNLLNKRISGEAQLVVAAGEKEPAAFHFQAQNLAASWAALKPEILSIAGADHFSVLEVLAKPDGILHHRVLQCFSNAT